MVKSARIVLAVAAPLMLLAALLTGVAAQGSFPTTPILDDFNQTDEHPAPGWQDIDGISAVQSNTLTCYSFPCVTQWDYTEFGPDLELYFTLESIADPGLVILRFANEHFLEIIHDTENGDSMYLNTGDQGDGDYIVWTPGDVFGVKCDGTTVSAYQNGGNPLFVLIESGSRIANYATFDLESDVQIDDFGGGTIEIESTPTPNPNMYGYGSVATITLSSGQILAVNYSYTFGDMGVITVGSLLVILLSIWFVYTITVKVWEWRDRR